MLPIEYSPTEAYMEAYETALKVFADSTAQAVGVLADKVMEKKAEMWFWYLWLGQVPCGDFAEAVSQVEI